MDFVGCKISVLRIAVFKIEETPINKFPQKKKKKKKNPQVNNYVHYVDRRTADLNICVKINQFNKVNLANVILLLKCNGKGLFNTEWSRLGLLSFHLNSTLSFTKSRYNTTFCNALHYSCTTPAPAPPISTAPPPPAPPPTLLLLPR